MCTIVGRMPEEKITFGSLGCERGIKFKAFIEQIISESVGWMRLVGVQWLTLMCDKLYIRVTVNRNRFIFK